MNRLSDALSPYLRQHADNPVDWWEWGAAAFDEARRRDVPVFLSVGYAACHWCHVMAHESFEDPVVGQVLSRDWVAVKVDREERPDVDATYMAAVTALTGHGGWPMTCLLTPDGDPFWGGTYLPRPNLLALLDGAGAAWRDRREELLTSSGRITAYLRQAAALPEPVELAEDDLRAAVRRLRTAYDEVRGGFGGAPKFPPSMVLTFLLRHHGRTGDPDALSMARHTCSAMRRGGLHDQLAGGFARYAVDATWTVPHFEKMLYDNALLARAYLHLVRATGDEWAKEVALSTCDWMLRDLGCATGGLAASLDADTVVDGHGEEGLTYVWTPEELVAVLGDEDGTRAATLLGVTATGTFEHGSSTLTLQDGPTDPVWWATVRARLLSARDERPQPTRDDKVVTSWNGLAVAALADVGAHLERPDLVEAARAVAEHALRLHLVDGRLRRASRDGVVGAPLAVLDDHGNLAEGLLALYQATGEARWLEAAGTVLDLALSHHRGADGSWRDSAAADLVVAGASASDNAEPSGLSAVAGALIAYAALTGSPDHRATGVAALELCGPTARQDPRFAGWALATAEAVAAGPLEVALVGPDGAVEELLAVARRGTSPGQVIAWGASGAPGQPLLADRPLVDGLPTAYVCRGFVCGRPVTDPDDLADLLRP